jgi:hypothetical protein
MAATIIDFLLAQQRDSSTSLVNGTVTFYAAGTTTLKAVWTDSLKVTEAANPYTLDARASAALYGDGNYKIVLKNALGATVATWDNVYVGADLSAIDLTSVIAAVSLTNRDYIGNSQFNIWNFGTTFTRTTVVDTPTADGWYYKGDGSGAGTTVISRQSFTFGQTDVPENPTYFTKLNKTGATTGATFEHYVFRLPIRTAAALEMTLRFYAKAAAPKDITVVAVQDFGSGGSADVTTSSAAITLTTGWVKYNKTFTVPSIAGKTLGSGAYLYVGIALPVNDTFNIDVASFKFETGDVASDNEFRTTYEDDLRTSGTVNAASSFLYTDTAGGTDEKYWKAVMDAAGKTFVIETLDDSQTNPKVGIKFTRSGTTITAAELPDIATPAGTDSSTKIATTAFVQQVAMNSALPNQTGSSGKFLTTNGTDASWGEVIMKDWARQVFDATGDFTVPAGVDVIYVSGCGGGAAGRAGADSTDRAGGGAGESVEMYPIPVTPADVITMTIGAGGTGDGGNGGNTTIGAYLTLYGGGKAASAGDNFYGGGSFNADGTRSTFDSRFFSADKKPGANASSTGATTGVSTHANFLNGAKAGTYMWGGAGGKYGAGGAGSAGATGGSAAANTGAGGGSGTVTAGAGGSGKVIVWWFA